MAFKDPASYTDPTQGKIKHIDFHIGVNVSTRILDIEATYQLQEPVEGSLYLDTFKINLAQKAHANGRPLQWECDISDDVLGERLHLKGFEGDSTFTLAFQTSTEARALQWLNASQTVGGQYPFLFSQCQAIHARSVFPCQDTPSVRFTYSAEMEVPQGLVAAMAAEQTGVQAGSGQTHFSFKMPQPIPSYLFALAVGNLAFHELGPRTGIYAEPSFFPEEQRIAVRTVDNPLSDLSAEYRLAPSPDGMKTLLTYVGTSKDKANLPIPLALQKSALRETFVAMIQALKKGIAAQGNTPRPAAAAS